MTIRELVEKWRTKYGLYLGDKVHEELISALESDREKEIKKLKKKIKELEEDYEQLGYEMKNQAERMNM